MSGQWKLVPVEPTETMVINGFESEPDECFTDEEVWEQYQGMSGCQQAAFRAKLCWAAMISSSPTSPEEDAQPVMKLEAERLWGGAGEYVVSFVKPGWLDECRKTGGEFLLYTHPDAGKVARLTAERDALQLLLNERDERLHSLEQSRRTEFDNGRAAEQRNEELSGMLQHLVDNPYRFTEAYRARIAAALNPSSKTPDQLREAAKMIGIERMPPMEYDEP